MGGGSFDFFGRTASEDVGKVRKGTATPIVETKPLRFRVVPCRQMTDRARKDGGVLLMEGECGNISTELRSHKSIKEVTSEHGQREVIK